MLAMFLLAGVGNPVERGAPIELDDRAADVWLERRIAQVRERPLIILGCLTVRVGQHPSHSSHAAGPRCSPGIPARHCSPTLYRTLHLAPTRPLPHPLPRSAGEGSPFTAILAASSGYSPFPTRGEGGQGV